MKKTMKYAVALLSFASATSLAGEFEFHGYFRAGAHLDLSDSLTRYDGFTANKLLVGRLGLEENNFELAFNKSWNFDDGKWLKIHTRLANESYENFDESGGFRCDTGCPGNNQAWGLSTGPLEIGLNETWVEMGGVFGDKDTTIWAGRRLYQRAENYSFIADVFYTDYSGTGIGFQGLPLGGGRFEAAWLTSNRYYHPEDITNGDPNLRDATDFQIEDVLHMIHTGYEMNGFNVEAAYKWFPTNGNTDSKTSASGFAEDGYEISVMYNFKDFFGLGNGFGKVVAQYGVGLSSGNLLGGTFTRLSSFRGLSRGQHFNLNETHEDDDSIRLIVHGGWIGEHVMIFPHILHEKTNYHNFSNGQDGDSEVNSFILRPVFPMPSMPNFMVIVEAGYQETENSFDSFGKRTASKIMVAPTFVMGTGEGPSPEIRLFTGIIDDNSDKNGGNNDNSATTIVGFQADLWW